VPTEGCCEHDDGHPVSVYVGEVLDQLKGYLPFFRMAARHPSTYFRSRLNLLLKQVTNLNARENVCLLNLYARMHCFWPNSSTGQYSGLLFKRVRFQISAQKAEILRMFSWYSSITPNSCRVRQLQ
jgi:hypothetical protein